MKCLLAFTLPSYAFFQIKIEHGCFNKFGWLLNLLHFIDNSFLLIINWTWKKLLKLIFIFLILGNKSRFIQMILHFGALIVALENWCTGLGSYVFKFLHTFKYGLHYFSEFEKLRVRSWILFWEVVFSFLRQQITATPYTE